MKENTLRIGRREFTVEAVLAMLSGAVITISGCGGSSYNNPTPTPTTTPTTTVPPASGDRHGAISANHGHVATITGAQITAGQALIGLDIQGQASHAHSISLSAAQVVSIGANQQVSVTSTNNSGHDHTVTFN
jgi:hypothetical protein